MRGAAKGISGEGILMAPFAELRVKIHEEGNGEMPDMAIETRPEELRLVEALLLAASEPLDEKTLAKHLPAGLDVRATLKRLQVEYAPRGVNLVRVGNKWTFRTANHPAWLLTPQGVEPKKLSRPPVQ